MYSQTVKFLMENATLMPSMRLPGLIDAHVHLRQPGMEYKEDFFTGTSAALAGGVTTVLDMPNTKPPTSTSAAFHEKVYLADTNAVCDVGLFVGATTATEDAYLPVAGQACALKIYVNETFGSLRIDELGLLHRLFRTWAENAEDIGYRTPDHPQGAGPIAVHAEELAVPVCILLADLYSVPLHIVHVSRRSEIELIRKAKEAGKNVTCEATPHHLFLTVHDAQRLGPLGDMRPKLASQDDVDALWENLDIIDIFATDHAPHSLQEKGIPNPLDNAPPGVPGVETMLPLLLTAVDQGKLELDDIIERCVHAPRRVYGIPEQEDTYIEVNVDERYRIDQSNLHSKCGWSPFHGTEVVGKVDRVVLRGEPVYEHGILKTERGRGQVLFRKGIDQAG